MLTVVKVWNLLRDKRKKHHRRQIPMCFQIPSVPQSDNIVGLNCELLITNICGTQRGPFTLQRGINIWRSKKEVLLFPGRRLQGMLRRALRQVLYRHSWIKQMSPRVYVSQNWERRNNSKQPLIMRGSPSCFRDWMLSASSGSGYKYSKLCYIMSFIHCYYGKVWLENCTSETNIIRFRDSWNKHRMKQNSQVPGPGAILKDSSTICLFKVRNAIYIWNIYY